MNQTLVVREIDKAELPLRIHTLQAPNENLRMSSSTTTNALHFETCNLVPKFLTVHYNQKVAPSIGTKGAENGRENIDPTHPTQLNPAQ